MGTQRFIRLCATLFISATLVLPGVLTNVFQPAFANSETTEQSAIPYEFYEQATEQKIKQLKNQKKKLEEQGKKKKAKDVGSAINILKERLAARNFDEEIAKVADEFHKEYLREEEQKSEWRLQALEKVMDMENKAKDEKDALEKVDNYQKALQKEAGNLKRVSYLRKQDKEKLEKLKVQYQIVEFYFNCHYMPVRLSELLAKQEKLGKEARDAKKRFVGKTLHGKLDAIDKKLQLLRPQISEARLKAQQAKAIEEGATEEELYRKGLATDQIKNIVGIMQSNARASISQDTYVRQNKPVYSGGVLGQAMPGALSSAPVGTYQSSVAFQVRELFQELRNKNAEEVSEVPVIEKVEEPVTETNTTDASLPEEEEVGFMLLLPQGESDEELSKDEIITALQGIQWEDEVMKKIIAEVFVNAQEENMRYMPITAMPDWDALREAQKTQEYLDDSLEQIIYGKYSDKVTGGGIGGAVLISLTGLDLPLDIRDLVHDFENWEWSLGHVGETAIDGIGLIPAIGVIKNAKYLNEAAAAGGKFIKKSDVVIDGVKELSRADEIVQVPISKLYGHATDDAANLFREGAVTHYEESVQLIKIGDDYMINDGVGKSMRALKNGEKTINADILRKYLNLDDLKKKALDNVPNAKSDLYFWENHITGKIDDPERWEKLGMPLQQ